MTLPASGAISLTDVLNELKVANPARALPLSLGDSDVIALAGKSGLPISMSDLYGKSSYIPLSVTGYSDSENAVSASSGSVICHPSVTVTGGSGGTTYLWSIVGPTNGCSLANTTLASCTVTHTYSAGATGSAHVDMQCVVGDNTSHSVTATGITADFDWAP